MLMSAAFLAATLLQFALTLVVAWLIGPAEFGRYALAVAGMALLQSLLVEWARLSATRFLSAGNDAALRHRFGGVFMRLGGLCLSLSALALVVGGEARELFALVPPAALLMGYAEFRAARLRALFDEGGYARFVLLRNLASALLMPAAAWFIGAAEAVLIAFVGALIPALALDHQAAARAGAGESGASAPTRQTILRYAGPLVVTNLAYHAIFLLLRAFVAWQAGLAASGQFSLALDFLLKIVQTLGSALDVWLFQLAVKASREGDAEATQKQLDRNAAIVLATLAPALLGVWLILPSVELLLVAPEFRGGFARYLGSLWPGMLLYGLIQYALHPFRQMNGRTDVIAYAAIATLGGVLFLMLYASLRMSAESGIQLLLGIGFLPALTALCLDVARNRSREPGGLRFAGQSAFAVRLALCLAAMLASGLLARALAPGLPALLLTVAAAGTVYLAAAWWLNLAGWRELLRRR